MMTLAVFATIALALAALLTLLLSMATSLFTMRAPSGPDSMGLFGLFLIPLVAWVLTLAAALLCVARGGFDWIGPYTGLPTLVVLFTVVGVAGASLVATAMSLEVRYDYRSVLGLAGGALLPLVVQVFIGLLTWLPPAELVGRAWPRIVGGPLLLIALAAWGTGAAFWIKSQIARSQREAEAYAESLKEEQREKDRRAQATQQQNAELDAMADTAPLESFLVRLGIDKTDDHHARVMDRIARLPALRDNLERILASNVPMDREWALNYIRHCQPPDPQLVPAVRAAMTRLAGEIRVASADQSIYAKGLMWGMLITADAYRPVTFDAEVRDIAEAMKGWPDEDARKVAAYYTSLYLSGQPVPH